MTRFARGVNDQGLPVGQWHPCAKLTDAETDKLQALHDEGLGYGKLAKMFDISKSQARNICQGRQRGQLAVRFVIVQVEPNKD